MRALVVSAVTIVVLVGSCRAPTQVRVTVRSDACTTSSSTAITIGSLDDLETKPPGPTSTRCDDGEVGSLVLQPSGDKDSSFAFKVVMGIDETADRCAAPGYKGCIVARRALAFLPHEDLHVVVDMRSSCKDRPCDPLMTCVNGSCVAARIADPSTCTAGCTEASLGAGSASASGPADGGSAPPKDAGITVKEASAGGDAQTACLPLNSECPVGSATTYCCAGSSCMGSSFGWRCCNGGTCKVGAGDCCALETCVDDGINGGRCRPR